MGSRTRIVAALAAALIAVASCRSDDPVFEPSTTPVPGTAGLPTGPALATVTLSAGTAEVSVTGGVEARATFEGVSSPAIYQPLPGTIAVTWGGGGLVITGPLNLGAHATIGGLSLSSSVDTDGPPFTFSSSAGECVITVDAAADRSFSGSFGCDGLVVGDVTVQAAGTFEASG